MSSNPNNALGTNGAYGGRTSVNAFNDVLGAFNNRGILSGWGCVPGSGLTVELGGNGSARDVALAEDNIGNKTTVNNISQAPIPVEMPAAPANNSRVDSIVAYIESSPSTNAETDNYSAVNLLVVSGNTGTTPSAPSESEIRTAITADGASGSTAYYVVLANITIPAGTTDIDATMISRGPVAEVRNLSGSHNFPTIGGGSGQSAVIEIPEQPDARYSVFAGFQTNSSGYSYLTPTVYAKTTKSFTLEVWNNSSGAVSGPTVDWLLIRNN